VWYVVVECEHVYKFTDGQFECIECGKRVDGDEWNDFNREWK
jgi:hypothetical protein